MHYISSTLSEEHLSLEHLEVIAPLLQKLGIAFSGSPEHEEGYSLGGDEQDDIQESENVEGELGPHSASPLKNV